MVRKLTALILLCLMATATATSLPGLRFCLCLEKFFLTGCECAEFCSSETESNSDCYGDCSKDSPQPSSGPNFCSDCSTEVHFELDDFVESVSQIKSISVREQLDDTSDIGPGLMSEKSLACLIKCSVHGTRGSPSSVEKNLSSLPLYKRFSVFLV